MAELSSWQLYDIIAVVLLIILTLVLLLLVVRTLFAISGREICVEEE